MDDNRQAAQALLHRLEQANHIQGNLSVKPAINTLERHIHEHYHYPLFLLGMLTRYNQFAEQQVISIQALLSGQKSNLVEIYRHISDFLAEPAQDNVINELWLQLYEQLCFYGADQEAANMIY